MLFGALVDEIQALLTPCNTTTLQYANFVETGPCTFLFARAVARLLSVTWRGLLDCALVCSMLARTFSFLSTAVHPY